MTVAIFSIFIITTLILNAAFCANSALLADSYVDSSNSLSNYGSSSFAIANGNSQYVFLKFERPPYNAISSANLILNLCDSSTCGASFPARTATSVDIWMCPETWQGEFFD